MLEVMSQASNSAAGLGKWTRAAANEGVTNDNVFNIDPTGNKASLELQESEAVAELQRRTRGVQNESLASSERALRKVLESEKVAGKSLDVLRVNSEQLSKVEGHLDEASHQVKVSNSKTDHLKSLNRYFFLPTFSGKKSKKLEKLIEKDRAQIAKRSDARVNNTYARSEELSKAIAIKDDDSVGPDVEYNTTPLNVERDANEVKIDKNLSGITKSLGKLKLMGQAMSKELDTQSKQVESIYSMTDNANEKIKNTNKKVYKLITK